MELTIEDLSFEPTLNRSATVRLWISYLDIKKSQFLILNPSEASSHGISELNSMADRLWAFFDRATNQFPRSYKIWLDYVDTRSSYVTQFLLTSEDAVRRANGTFERAISNLWVCPRLWINYIDFIGRQNRLTLLRRVFSAALQSLPVTQHDRIWESYLPVIRRSHCIPIVKDGYSRFLKVHPEHIEDAADWFLSENATKESSELLQKIIMDVNFKSAMGRTKFYWYTKLANVLMDDPLIEGAEKTLLDCAKEFPSEIGRVWVILSNHYARLGRFADAIQVFETAMTECRSATDFSVIFEGASQLLLSLSQASQFHELFAKKLENLLDRQPILLNAVLLRQNPDDVGYWIERSVLYLDLPYEYTPTTRPDVWARISVPQQSQLLVFEEAIETVKKACDGTIADLWIGLSKIADNPKCVLRNAIDDEDMLPSDLVSIYCYFAEVEVSDKESGKARDILLEGIDRLKNFSGASKLWSFAIDMEWNLGGSASICSLFDMCLSSKAVTLRHVVSYAKFLEDDQQIGQMFRVFERGIAISQNNESLWLLYLYKFVEKFGDTKQQRTRELFEEAIKNCENSLKVSILYAKFEEDHGLIRNAMDIYRRAADSSQDDNIINVWIASAIRLFGISKARQVYEYAISKFKDRRAAEWCIKYAKVEAKLTEFDRARTILVHGCQFADPEAMPEYWDAYNEFEVAHGTKETFSEMLSQKNLAMERFNRTVHVGLAREGKEIVPETEEKELAEAEATRVAMIQDQKIAQTIFDAGTYTIAERFERRGKKK